MATDTRTLNSAITTDAIFRAWATGVAAQLAAAGLVKTADSGQIDLATVVKPASASLSAGYEIYRFNDALQATAPIFLKVEYGTGVGSATLPALWITVGTGSDGAGALTGQVNTRRQVYAQVTGSAPSHCSGTMAGAEGGRVTLLTNYNLANLNFVFGFVVERTKDASGAATADGYFIATMGNFANGTNFTTVPMVGLIPAGSRSLPTFKDAPAGPGGLSINGVNVAMLPFMCIIGKLLFATPLVYANGDIAAGSVIAVQHLGALRNYLTLGPWMTDSGTTSAAAYALAIRWE